MMYRHAVDRQNYTDLSSGGVLFSAPGFPAFPARLASEIFQRAVALRPGGPVRVWDPCCGSGYLLTVLALMHRSDIVGVLGTDIDPSALALAERNLGLLTQRGFASRAEQLSKWAQRWDKPAYLETARAARRLARRLQEDGGPLPIRVAQADVFEPDQLRRSLRDYRPGLVVADVPYGERTFWKGQTGSSGTENMLRSIDSVLDRDAVIAVVARGRKVHVDDARRAVASFRIGSRAVAFFRPARCA